MASYAASSPTKIRLFPEKCISWCSGILAFGNICRWNRTVKWYQNGFVYKFETDSETGAPDNAISHSLSMCDSLPQSSNDNTALTFYQKMTVKPWIWVIQSYDIETYLILKVSVLVFLETSFSFSEFSFQLKSS